MPRNNGKSRREQRQHRAAVRLALSVPCSMSACESVHFDGHKGPAENR